MIRKFGNSPKVKEAAKKALEKLKALSAEDLLKLGEDNKNRTNSLALKDL